MHYTLSQYIINMAALLNFQRSPLPLALHHVFNPLILYTETPNEAQLSRIEKGV